jgi:hypothetical protein
VIRRVGEAKRHPTNPVLPLGMAHEWDSLQASPWSMRGILYDPDEKLFKCWYSGKDLTMRRWWASGYAVSEDGVHWVKPRLGLHEYNGNANNNIFTMDAFGVVIRDAAEPDPSKRYKMYRTGDVKPRRAIYYSADGMTWRVGWNFEITPWNGPKIWDHVNFMRDDLDPDPQRRYKIIWQSYYPNVKAGPPEIRGKCLAWSPGEGHAFTPAPGNPILSPNDGLEQENHFTALFTYEGLWVLLYEYGFYMPNGRGKYGGYTADVRLAVSRDGQHYDRIEPSQPVLRRGEPGAWDDGFVVTSNSVVVKDDTIYLHYCGQSMAWAGWPPQNKPADLPVIDGKEHPGPGSTRESRMGLATMRLDGFAYLQSTDAETPGLATTAPIDVKSRDVALVVNVDQAIEHRGFVQAEVLDAANDQPIAGYTLDECHAISRDGVRVAATWKDNATLRNVAAPSIKLRFRLCGPARLYSYTFGKR